MQLFLFNQYLSQSNMKNNFVFLFGIRECQYYFTNISHDRQLLEKYVLEGNFDN